MPWMDEQLLPASMVRIEPDDLEAECLDPLALAIEISDPKGQVVKALSAAVQERSVRRAISTGRHELDRRASRDLHPAPSTVQRFVVIEPLDHTAKDRMEPLQRAVKVWHDDADMIQREAGPRVVGLVPARLRKHHSIIAASAVAGVATVE
jgi:hypothetical protein